jgi:hypothetical protein
MGWDFSLLQEGEFPFVLEGRIYFFLLDKGFFLFNSEGFFPLRGGVEIIFFERFVVPFFKENMAGWGCGWHICSKNMLYTV